jgi:hypothetical protein
MPLYHHLPDWNGLDIKALPLESWRKRFPFWPYFVGQKVRLELVVTKAGQIEKGDLQFHGVEKMENEAKPTIISLSLKSQVDSQNQRTLELQSSSLITSKGEIKYWLSNRGYNVEHEPIFTTEAINLDLLVLPIALMVLVPLLGFLAGLVLGLVLGG